MLFVSICSLTKSGGGHDEYDSGEAIGSELTPRLVWQGVALPELEYNRHLARGPDFGGDSRARYRPAVERYEGRFFLGLGSDRGAVLRASPHHLLLLSGLYGVLRSFEPIQL